VDSRRLPVLLPRSTAARVRESATRKECEDEIMFITVSRRNLGFVVI